MRYVVEQALGCEYYITIECHGCVIGTYSSWISYDNSRIGWLETEGSICTADGEEFLFKSEVNLAVPKFIILSIVPIYLLLASSKIN